MAAAAAPQEKRHWLARPGPWIAAIAVGVVGYGILAASTDVRSVVKIWAGVSPLAVLLAFSLSTSSFVARAFRWHFLLRLSGHPARWTTSGLTYFLGLAMAITPGKAAESLKAHYANRRDGVPISAGVAAFLCEKTADGLAVFVILAFAAPGRELKLASLGIALALVGFLMAISRHKVSMPPPPKPPRSASLWVRTKAFGGRLFRASQPMLHVMPLGLGLSTGVFAWIVETTAMFALAKGLGIEASWQLCAFAYGVGSIAGFFSLVPGGLGIAELGMVGVLVANGLPMTSAVALAVGIRTATLWWGLGLGAVALAVTSWRPQERGRAAPKAKRA